MFSRVLLLAALVLPAQAIAVDDYQVITWPEDENMNPDDPPELPPHCYEKDDRGNYVFANDPDCWGSVTSEPTEDHIYPPGKRLRYIKNDRGEVYGMYGNAYGVVLTDRRGRTVATISDRSGSIAYVGFFDMTGYGHEFVVVNDSGYAGSTGAHMEGSYVFDLELDVDLDGGRR